MPELTITTFNCENLLMRCDFSKPRGISNPREQLTNIHSADRANAVDEVFNVLSEDDRTLTAQALAATNADVCALQEVENLVVLMAFHNRYLRQWTRRGYAHRILFEGNDRRGIDVAALSRLQVLKRNSHARRTLASFGIEPLPRQCKNDRAFRRDCLQLEVAKQGRGLTIFVCHFKSMHGGRKETRPIREQEAQAVRRLIEERFDDPAKSDWIVCGDLNDYFERDGQPARDHGLGPLLDNGFAVDALKLANPEDPLDRWTHHYPREASYSALDHILLSPKLAALNEDKLSINVTRIGMPWRAERYEGFRLPGIGWSKPKASDHCPLTAKIHFEGEAI